MIQYMVNIFLKVGITLSFAITAAFPHEKHSSSVNYVSPKEEIEIGEGSFRYKLVPGWATENADKYKLGNCNAISQDSRGRILLLHTSKEQCLIALSPEGKVLDAWGNFTVAAHGLAVVKEKGGEVLFISDHSPNGKIYKTTLDGEILMTISCPMESKLYKNPNEFKPAKTLHLPNGEFYVIDGYGKDYIHKFNAEGKWISAFGGDIGTGEAQLKHWGPHGGAIDYRNPTEPVMILALSDQQKIKRFTLNGKWIDTKTFPGSNPRDVIFHRGHLFVHHLGDNWPKDRNAPGYISVMDHDLKVVANLGGYSPKYDDSGKLSRMSHNTHLFHHPHGMGIDKEGNIYIAQASSNGTWPLKFTPTIKETTTRTWIVSPEGNDKNEGNKEKPFRTISHAAQIAQAGDTVLVRPGIYRERVAPPRSGEPGKPITYRTEELGNVFIRGSEKWDPTWKKLKDNVHFAKPDPSIFESDDVYVDHPNPFLVPLASTPYNRQGKPEHERTGKGNPELIYNCGQVIVNGRPWQQRPFLKEVTGAPKTWNFDSETGNIYMNFGNQDPAKQSVEITTRRRIFAPHSIGIGHIIIEGFVMEHCGNQYPTNFWNTPKWAQAGALGLRGGHHWIVRNNLIRYAGTDAIDMGAGGGQNERKATRVPSAPLGHHNLIEKNYIIENGAGGIIGAQSNNLIIRNNVIMFNNTLGFTGKKRYEHAGIKSHAIRDGLIERNYVADNQLSEGIWLDNQFPNTRVTRNISTNNGSRGIFLEMSDYKYNTALIDHNISVGNNRIQFYVHDASGSTVMHNLFANSPSEANYGQGAYIYQVNARTKTGYHSIYNNIFVNHRVMMDINYPSHRSGPQRLDHNIYDASTEERTFIINNASDKPSPWSPKEFYEMVRKEVDKGNPTPLHGGSKVGMTLNEWQTFWAHHGLKNDQNSVTKKGMVVSYDQTKLKLTIRLTFDPSDIGSIKYEKIKMDYEGNLIPKDGSAIPGPFQNLRKGNNIFNIWDGLPLLKKGELPITNK